MEGDVHGDGAGDVQELYLRVPSYLRFLYPQ